MRSWILNNALNIEYKLNIKCIAAHNTKLHTKLNLRIEYCYIWLAIPLTFMNNSLVSRTGAVRYFEVWADIISIFPSYLSSSSCLSFPSFRMSDSYTSVFPDFLDKCRQDNERTDCWERNRIQASRLWKNVDKVNMKREKNSAGFKTTLVNLRIIRDRNSWEGCTTHHQFFLMFKDDSCPFAKYIPRPHLAFQCGHITE